MADLDVFMTWLNMVKYCNIWFQWKFRRFWLQILQTVFQMCFWRFVNTRSQCHSLTFDPGLIFWRFTASPQKSLRRLLPNFIQSLRGSREQNSIQTIQVTLSIWPPCLYMVKTFKNLILQNQLTDFLEPWYVSLNTRVLPRLYKWWPLVDLYLFHRN